MSTSPGQFTKNSDAKVMQEKVDNEIVEQSDMYEKYNQKRKENEHALSNTRAIMSLVKGTIGSGILSLPKAFHDMGLWAGVVVTSAVILVSIHSMSMLVNAEQYLAALHGVSGFDYATTAVQSIRLHSGNAKPKLELVARYSINSAVILFGSGTCVTYIIFFAKNLRQVAGHYMSASLLTTMDDHVFIGLTLLPVILLSFIKRLRALSIMATISNVFYLGAAAVLLTYMFGKTPDLSSVAAVRPVTGWPLALGTILFSFESINLVIPIENEMAKPASMTRNCGVLHTALLPTLCLYVAMGFFGYLRFGEDIEETISLNLPDDQPLYQAVKLAFALALLLSFFLQFYVYGVLVQSFLSGFWSQNDRRFGYVEHIMRLLMILFIFLLALLVPHIDLVISLIGSISGASMTFIFPPIIDILITLHRKRAACTSCPTCMQSCKAACTLHATRCTSCMKRVCIIVKDSLMLAFGVFALAVGSFSSLYAIVKASSF